MTSIASIPLPTALAEFGVSVPSPRQADECVALQLVTVENIRVNAAYQRNLSSRGLAVIKRIISRFSWSKFGAITVAENDDGTYAVIDGQHRAAAALMLRIKQVPAVIVLRTDLQAEADSFVGINSDRTTVSPVDKFRARITAGDKVAAELAETLTALQIDYDLPPGALTGARQTRAISLLEKLAQKHGRGTLFAALEMMLDGQPDNPELLTSMNIFAVTELTREAIDAGKRHRQARRRDRGRRFRPHR